MGMAAVPSGGLLMAGAVGLTGAEMATSGGSSSSALNQNADYVNGVITHMNSLLNNALSQASYDATGYTNQANQQLVNYNNAALQNLQTGLTNSTNALNTGLNNANTNATSLYNKGLNQYVASQSPWATQGYNAADALSDSLGLARPAIGSTNLASGLNFYNQTVNPQINALQSAANANNMSSNQFGTPSQQALQSLPTAPTLQALLQEPSNNVPKYTPFVGVSPGQYNAAAAVGNQAILNVRNQNNAITAQNQAAQQAYQNQVNNINSSNTNLTNLFNTQNNAYNSLNNTLQGINPQLLAQLIGAAQGQFNNGGVVNVGPGGQV